MTQDHNLRGARPITPRIGIVELDTIVVLQQTPHLLPQHTLTHSVDHDQFAFAIADGRFQRTFEIAHLEFELFAIAQAGFVLHEFV